MIHNHHHRLRILRCTRSEHPLNRVQTLMWNVWSKSCEVFGKSARGLSKPDILSWNQDFQSFVFIITTLSERLVRQTAFHNNVFRFRSHTTKGIRWVQLLWTNKLLYVNEFKCQGNLDHCHAFNQIWSNRSEQATRGTETTDNSDRSILSLKIGVRTANCRHKTYDNLEHRLIRIDGQNAVPMVWSHEDNSDDWKYIPIQVLILILCRQQSCDSSFETPIMQIYRWLFSSSTSVWTQEVRSRISMVEQDSHYSNPFHEMGMTFGSVILRNTASEYCGLMLSAVTFFDDMSCGCNPVQGHWTEPVRSAGEQWIEMTLV